MANTDKNIVITPAVGSSSIDPNIVFSGADSGTAAQDITLTVTPSSNGTLTASGSGGTLFSVNNDGAGSFLSSIAVDSNQVVRIAETSGRLLVGTSTANDNGTSAVQITGSNSSSTTTGALVVNGGIGVSGDFYASDIYSNGQLIQGGSGIGQSEAIAYSIAFGS